MMQEGVFHQWRTNVQETMVQWLPMANVPKSNVLELPEGSETAVVAVIVEVVDIEAGNAKTAYYSLPIFVFFLTTRICQRVFAKKPISCKHVFHKSTHSGV